jgi:oxygen-independent coproporphyrinogen-3 oxidase
MAGVYIHIPFCRQACHYCNFHFSVSHRLSDALVECLIREMQMQAGFFRPDGSAGGRTRLDSLYIGGGTPSVLPVPALQRLFAALGECFAFDGRTEVTLEANPDDLDAGCLASLRDTPVNRLSIGIQSFHQADLLYMNRIHTPGQALRAIKDARRTGFDNLTVDLIYGTPTLSDKGWEQNLEKVFGLEVPHMSAYALTVEKKTPLDVMIRKGQAAPVDEDQVARQFEILMDRMAGRGYEHYEISNFSLPGRYSRHNLSYWDGSPYLGLGPSAHSHREGQRWWNVSNTAAYVASLRSGLIPFETEELGPAQRFDEYVMTSLRTQWGCSLQRVAGTWGRDRREALLLAARPYLANGQLARAGEVLRLTRSGRLFADRIASELFWED